MKTSLLVPQSEFAQPAHQGRRPAHLEPDQVPFVLPGVHHHSGLDRRQRRALLLWNPQLGLDHRIGVERSVQRLQQRLHPLAGARRNRDFAAALRPCQEPCALVLSHQVDLVQHLDARLAQNRRT